MYIEVPEVKKCCLCLPLRRGIITFAYLNVIISIMAIISLTLMTELKNFRVLSISGLDITSTASLFSVLGLLVILNVVLLIGGHQKDMKMLNLYNCYAIAMVFAGMIPVFIMMFRMQLFEATAGLVAVCVQTYVIILVRSEIIEMEDQNALNTSENIETPTFEYVTFV